MTLFARQGFQYADLALLNHCWMHLHVILLSDICNGTSTRIEKQYWSGSKAADIHQFQLPTMAKLTTGEWEFWQRGLQLSLDLSH